MSGPNGLWVRLRTLTSRVRGSNPDAGSIYSWFGISQQQVIYHTTSSSLPLAILGSLQSRQCSLSGFRDEIHLLSLLRVVCSSEP